MTPHPARSLPRADKEWIAIAIAVVAAFAGLALLALMLFAAPLLVRWGLVGHLWFVLLLALGLCAAIVVFGVFRSWAHYTGNVLAGKLELGGPSVVMLVVVVLGFVLVPAPVAPFDVTVFIQTRDGGQPVALQGELSIDLGPDRRVETIGSKAEVRFVGIPSNLRGDSAKARLSADRYELSGPNPQVKLDAGAQYLLVQVKALRLAGIVAGEQGDPIAKARVSIAGLSEETDVDGRFLLNVPADVSQGERYIMVTAAGFKPYRALVAPGGNLLQIRLSK